MRLVLPLHILAFTPMWVLALLFYALTIGIIWALRDYQEGLGYNVARSSQLGDAALFGIVLMAVNMLQDGRNISPALNLASMQFSIFIIAVVVGLLWYFWFDPTPRWGDRYHHLVVAPMLVYLSVNAGIIILYAGKGWEILAAVALFVFWAGLVIWDANTGRLDQTTYLRQKQGIVLTIR